MRLCVINPNTTARMTASIGEAARAIAAPGTQIVAVNPADGPASIEGYYDEAFSIPGLLKEIRNAEGADGFIIACFDDTGLDAARTLTKAPVIGIGEAAYHMASLIAGRFSVITTLACSIPALEHNLVKYGLERRCAKVRAAEVQVLELDDPNSGARARIDAEIIRAKQEDHAEAIVLGCAGMAALAADLTRTHNMPVVDGVSAAVTLVEGLVRMGLKTSSLGGYAPPRPKAYTGRFSGDGV